MQAQVHSSPPSSHMDLPISIIGARLATDPGQSTAGHPLVDTPLSGGGSSVAASSSFGEPLGAAFGGHMMAAHTMEEETEDYGGPASSSTSFSIGRISVSGSGSALFSSYESAYTIMRIQIVLFKMKIYRHTKIFV